MRRIVPALAAISVAAGLWWFDLQNDSRISTPVQTSVLVETDDSSVSADAGETTLTQLLDQARRLTELMSGQLDDYTAVFVKQERDDDGRLGEESRIAMKVQTKFRGPNDDAAKRVYLKFESPAALAGREVLWGEDLYEGQMAVHETGFLLGLKTIWLHPTGMIAMNGQRYPISEIGMVRLAEKLIERGDVLQTESGLSVQIDSSVQFGDEVATRYRIIRSNPVGGDDDFSVAEIVMDLERNLILQYRSFGWENEVDGSPQLLESYSYLNVRTNVGLTDEDFDVGNPEYHFP